MKITITLTDKIIRTDIRWTKPEEDLSTFNKIALLTEALLVGIREITKIYLPKNLRVNYIRAISKMLEKICC